MKYFIQVMMILCVSINTQAQSEYTYVENVMRYDVEEYSANIDSFSRAMYDSGSQGFLWTKHEALSASVTFMKDSIILQNGGRFAYKIINKHSLTDDFEQKAIDFICEDPLGNRCMLTAFYCHRTGDDIFSVVYQDYIYMYKIKKQKVIPPDTLEENMAILRTVKL